MADDNVVVVLHRDPAQSSGSDDQVFYDMFDKFGARLEDLACAVLALQASNALDGCEIGSKARNVVSRCSAELDELHQSLDAWYLARVHPLKPAPTTE